MKLISGEKYHVHHLKIMFLLSNILELHVWPFTSQTEMNYNTDVSCFMKSEFLFISLVQEYTCTKKRQEKLILFKGFLSLSVVKLELHIFINISSLFTWLAFWFSRIRSKKWNRCFLQTQSLLLIPSTKFLSLSLCLFPPPPQEQKALYSATLLWHSLINWQS